MGNLVSKVKNVVMSYRRVLRPQTIFCVGFYINLFSSGFSYSRDEPVGRRTDIFLWWWVYYTRKLQHHLISLFHSTRRFWVLIDHTHILSELNLDLSHCLASGAMPPSDAGCV